MWFQDPYAKMNKQMNPSKSHENLPFSTGAPFFLSEERSVKGGGV